jgi:hypothetical protein
MGGGQEGGSMDIGLDQQVILASLGKIRDGRIGFGATRGRRISLVGWEM